MRHPNFSCRLTTQKRPISSPSSSRRPLAPQALQALAPTYTPPRWAAPSREAQAHSYLCGDLGGRGLRAECSRGSCVPRRSDGPAGACRGPFTVAWLCRGLPSRSPYRSEGDTLVRPAREESQEETGVQWGPTSTPPSSWTPAGAPGSRSGEGRGQSSVRAGRETPC